VERSRFDSFGPKGSQVISHGLTLAKRAKGQSLAWIGRRLGPDVVVFDGVRLPAPKLRPCGTDFADNALWVNSGRREAQRLISLGLTPDSAVLDLGCGPGRLATGLLFQMPSLRRYEGLDVNPRSIAWCRRNIQREHPSFHFSRSDAPNERYNPNGRGPVALPFADSDFDFAYLHSIFTHMRANDVAGYLRELRRVLADDGVLFFTAFAEEGVLDEEVNPDGYVREWQGALHCVRFSRAFLERMCTEAGFSIVSAQPDAHGQTAFVAR